jgi:hypothetical protein
MSHVTRVNTTLTVKETPHLHAAAKCLGLEQRVNAAGQPLRRAKTYNGHFDAEIVFGIPGNTTAYEMGLKLDKGKWDIMLDNFNGGYGLGEVVGHDGQRFIQKVSDLRVAEAAAASMLSEVGRKVLADGTIVIELEPSVERQFLQSVGASY